MDNLGWIWKLTVLILNINGYRWVKEADLRCHARYLSLINILVSIKFRFHYSIFIDMCHYRPFSAPPPPPTLSCPSLLPISYWVSPNTLPSAFLLNIHTKPHVCMFKYKYCIWKQICDLCLYFPKYLDLTPHLQLSPFGPLCPHIYAYNINLESA